MACVVQVSTGPMVRLCSRRDWARAFILSSRPAWRRQQYMEQQKHKVKVKRLGLEGCNAAACSCLCHAVPTVAGIPGTPCCCWHEWRQQPTSPALAHLAPVFVHDEQALCAALLAAAGVCVLVGLPGHIVDLGHIGPQQLPVIAGVLQEDLCGGERLGGGLRWWLGQEDGWQWQQR